MKFRIICVFLVFSFSLLWYGTGNAQKSFDVFLDSLQSQPFYKYAELGFSLKDVTSGEILAAYRDKKLMIPASGLKVLTNVCAYDLLGKNYTFDTGIFYQGKINDQGILTGNIIVSGGGDPTLGSSEILNNPGLEARLAEIELAVKKVGIQKIEGDIIADVSFFSSLPVPDSWQYNDIGNYYGAGAWAVNVFDNQYSVYFDREKKIGDKAGISYIDPFIPGLEIDNLVTVDSAGTGDNVYIFGGPGQCNKKATGTVPFGKGVFSVKGSIPDPPLYFAYRLFQKLNKNGIQVNGYKTENDIFLPDSLSPLTTLHSPPLHKIIKVANSESINLYSEAILLILGKNKEQKYSRKEGIRKIKDYLVNSRISQTSILLEDGSGLSARNLVSADLFTSLLVHAVKKHGEYEILSLMPKAGLDGTVKKLLAGTKIQSDIWAKSGSMNSIVSYTGFVRTGKGKLVAFSIMINGSMAEKAKSNRMEAEKIISAIHKFF